jgi:hypothetical protein
VGPAVFIQVLINDAGFQIDLEIRQTEVENAIHLIKVQNNPPLNGNRIAFEAGPRTPGRHRYFMRMGQRQDLPDFIGPGGPEDQVGRAGGMKGFIDSMEVSGGFSYGIAI